MTQPEEKKKSFVLYDSRAWNDVSRAAVYVCAETEEEAIQDSIDAESQGWGDGVWYEYDAEPAGEKSWVLVNEKIRPDIMITAATIKA